MPSFDQEQHARARRFARDVLVLQRDSETTGVAPLFDEALTNGLAAIVKAEWPEQLLRSDSKIKSAGQLLDVTEAKARSAGQGRRQVGTTVLGEPVLVDIEALREGIALTQPSRHASHSDAAGELAEKHIAALAALDEHPALRQLDDEWLDEHWQRVLSADAEERERAAAYWANLPEDEQQRRDDPELARHNEPWDPKERIEFEAPQECPVCELEALVVEGTDDFGWGIGHGTCMACGYRRSREVAYDLAMDREIERHRDE